MASPTLDGIGPEPAKLYVCYHTPYSENSTYRRSLTVKTHPQVVDGSSGTSGRWENSSGTKHFWPTKTVFTWTTRKRTALKRHERSREQAIRISGSIQCRDECITILRHKTIIMRRREKGMSEGRVPEREGFGEAAHRHCPPSAECWTSAKRGVPRWRAERDHRGRTELMQPGGVKGGGTLLGAAETVLMVNVAKQAKHNMPYLQETRSASMITLPFSA